MGKHAYLILAHNKLDQLAILLQTLDDSRNDVYLLLDSKLGQVDEKPLREAVKKGNLYIIKNRISVSWGQFSQIKARMILLEEACTHKDYEYYHNLSGQDLPIKSQDYIHDFFHFHAGKEFISYNNPDSSFRYTHRCRYYYDFLDFVGRPKGKLQKAGIFTAA